jgi:chromosome segregation ATPase
LSSKATNYIISKRLIMPTPEEMQTQIDSLNTRVSELTKGTETLTSEKSSLAEQLGTMKEGLDKANADLIVAQKEPNELRVSLDQMKDVEAKTANELTEAKSKVNEFDTVSSQLADFTTKHKEAADEVDRLKGRVRATTIGALVKQHGLKEDNLKDKDLPALEAIASALDGQQTRQAANGDSGLGLGDSGTRGVSDRPLSPIETADRELAALRSNSN